MKDFKLLINKIFAVHNLLQQHAVNSINRILTTRNWLYIVEYEQNGNDRAEYGTKLLATLAKKFKNTKRLDERSFRNFRLFYNKYSQIGFKNYRCFYNALFSR